MKTFYQIAFGVVLACVLTMKANAAVLDTVYADAEYFGSNPHVVTSSNAFGKPDSQYAKLQASAGGSYFYASFHRRNGSVITNEILPIKPKSTLIVWGKKDPDVDSSYALLYFSSESAGLIQSQAFRIGDGINIIEVPDTSFEYLDFEIAGTGSLAYWIDAIAVIEDTSQSNSGVRNDNRMNSIGLMRNYPNPFSNLTTVSFTMPTSGQATLVVVNMQGTEIARTDIGYLGEGTQRASFELHEHGMYFLRLFVDGRPVGNPIKVVSE